MKNFVFSLIASVAMLQSAYAATSALTESLLEYEAITSALGTDPSFENVIPPTEFIIDIKRITKDINVLGEVKYEILTRAPPVELATLGCHDSHERNIRYIATLEVTANPGIGPNIVTVVRIVQIEIEELHRNNDNDHHHHHE